MRVLLDSGAYSQLMRGREQVSRIVRGAEEVLLSAVVLGELLHGFRHGSRYERNIRQMRASSTIRTCPSCRSEPPLPTATRGSWPPSKPRAVPFPPTTSGSQLTPWRREPIWCRPTAASSMWTFRNPTSPDFRPRGRGAVESVRRGVAALVCLTPEEINWISGGTEAMNLALNGSAFARRAFQSSRRPEPHERSLVASRWSGPT